MLISSISFQMSIVYDLRHILIFLLALQISQCTNIPKYDCVDAAHTSSIRTYNSIIEYQHSNMPFDRNENYVAFNVTTIRQLKKNDFIAYDSNHIRKLFLNDKRIETIDKGTFNELFCVKYLLLQDNLIETIEAGTFHGLYSVEELYLNNNNIQNIPNGAFSYLEHLLKLDLSNNKISTVSFQAFMHLKSLWELHLEHNQISDLHFGMFIPTPHLLKLYLGNNKFSGIPDHIAQSTNLGILDVSNNKIQHISRNLFEKLDKLTDLKLSGNQLYELDINVPGLKRIYIENNAWQCDNLEKIVHKLFSENIEIILNKVTYTNNLTVTDLGCYRGGVTYTSVVSTTTGIPWWKLSSTTSTTSTTEKPPTTTGAPKINDNSNDHYMSVKDKDTIISAIYDLKIVIILLVVVVVIFHVSDIIQRLNICDRYRRRFSNSNQFQFSGQSGSSLPLLLR